ncbi:hypothetical protein AMTRI_Chr09g12850 [Amborella trichopoda]
MDDLTRHLHDEVPWCMSFADDIVFIDENRNSVNTKLEPWRDALKSKGFKINRTKTEHLECKFSNTRSRDEEVIKIDGHVKQKRPHLRYLGSIIQKNGEIEEDASHKIRAEWPKWRCVNGILCNHRIPMRLKGKFYKTAVRSALLNGVECWAKKK